MFGKVIFEVSFDIKTRTSFKKIKGLGIGCFVKNALWEFFFFNVDKTFQKLTSN